MSLSNGSVSSENLKIVTIDNDQESVLKQKTRDFELAELPLAQEIAELLFKALEPYVPAAGLAAPQIGISRSIFIYSYDRDPKNLEVVINPNYTPLDGSTFRSWEGCFSALLCESCKRLANIPRHQRIRVSYINLNGETVEKDLEGFEAKVFQHEYDHLQGMVNIYRPDAEVKSFNSTEEVMSFMDEVKRADSSHYKH